MATVAVVIKTTKKLSNNEYAVAIRATHDRQSRYYPLSTLVTNQSLPWRCNADQWKPAEEEDNGLGKFRKTFLPYKECNEILKAKLDEAKRILKQFDEDNNAFDFDQFESQLKKKDVRKVETKSTLFSSVSIQSYYAQQILILEEQKREGMAGLYRENQSILKKFKPNAMLTDIDFRFLESFEYWMRNDRGNMDTTISVKLRNLQRVINQAIDDKLFDKDNYPFGAKLYSVTKRLDHSTKKIAIHTDKVGKLKAPVLKPGSSLHFAQQICLFSYYCRGMNFIDITFLRWGAVSETTLEYRRIKTGGKFVIPLNAHSLAILDYFKRTHTDNHGFVFPIINPLIHVTTKQKYTRKKTALKAMNDNLKKLANMIGEPTLKLSTNMLRHSYATGMKRAGANTSYITEALGHATQEQTQTYLDEFEKGVIESWENKMFNI